MSFGEHLTDTEQKKEWGWQVRSEVILVSSLRSVATSSPRKRLWEDSRSRWARVERPGEISQEACAERSSLTFVPLVLRLVIQLRDGMTWLQLCQSQNLRRKIVQNTVLVAMNSLFQQLLTSLRSRLDYRIQANSVLSSFRRPNKKF